MAALILLGVVVLFGLITLASSIFTVSSGNAAVIQRFGKFNRTGGAGLNLKLPFAETKFEISLMVQQVDLKMETKTKDNVFVAIPVSVQYSIIPTMVYEAVYTMSNFKGQMESIVNNILLGHIPSMDFDEVYSWNRSSTTSCWATSPAWILTRSTAASPRSLPGSRPNWTRRWARSATSSIAC